MAEIELGNVVFDRFGAKKRPRIALFLLAVFLVQTHLYEELIRYTNRQKVTHPKAFVLVVGHNICLAMMAHASASARAWWWFVMS